MSRTLDQTAGTLPLRSGAPAGAGQLRSRIIGILRTMSRWVDRSNQRHALAELDDHLLRDVGLSRSAARREATKPFWT